MSIEKINLGDSTNVTITRDGKHNESVEMHGYFTVVCKDASGNMKWKDGFDNLVTTSGKNALLDAYLSGAAVGPGTTTWYMGLIAANGYSDVSVLDTASSHSGWKESGENNASAPGYVQATRRQLTFAAASAGAKATSNAAVFTINVAGTIKGAFIANNSVKAGSLGVLYSAGLFTAGDKIVISGDTLNVTYSASA